MTRPTIVFDLDGTLIDTAPDLIEAINHTLAGEGLAAADADWLRPYVGHGGRAMIERCYAVQKRVLKDGDMARLLEVFIARYGDTMPGLSRPYPGVLDAIDRFASAGWRVAICTNKLEELALRLIASLELSDRFQAICGADTFAFRKPDPRHLTETILRAGGNAGLGLMVGDSRTDIDTAKAAGLPVAAVDFGYTDRHVREFEPSLVISHFDELTVEAGERLVAASQGTRGVRERS
ncbi:MAG: phosphoglycolate phosphatase [Rhizobiaceae bacterium]|nr:phosphoglycolate phosphatase [Rhizobiaceae bacterium]MCV0407401.1 phosphoglycolate phosphatase [Rhizobiaceae bacterium]